MNKLYILVFFRYLTQFRSRLRRQLRLFMQSEKFDTFYNHDNLDSSNNFYHLAIYQSFGFSFFKKEGDLNILVIGSQPKKHTIMQPISIVFEIIVVAPFRVTYLTSIIKLFALFQF